MTNSAGIGMAARRASGGDGATAAQPCGTGRSRVFLRAGGTSVVQRDGGHGIGGACRDAARQPVFGGAGVAPGDAAQVAPPGRMERLRAFLHAGAALVVPGDGGRGIGGACRDSGGLRAVLQAGAALGGGASKAGSGRATAQRGPGRLRALLIVGAAVAALGGCAQGTGIAWPGAGGGQAAPAAAPRPAPDQRGVISFPSFQVVVARMGETASSIGQRLGIDGGRLASHNAVDPNAQLGQGAVLTLPGGPGGSVQVRDPFAGQGVRPYDIPGGGAAGTAAAGAAAAPAPAAAGPDPRQHQVQAGETAWSIARRYGVTVADLASWNGLPADMAIRTGQRLTIPAAGARPGAQGITAPGAGSPTPRPPSAADALPDETTTPPASRQAAAAPAGPDLGATRTSASSRGHFTMPATGPIARAYRKGSNDGIDIQADPGSTVKAAAGGTVAAVTRDTNGMPIVVIRHQGELMTVYTGIDALSVAKGDTVTAGQAIGKARPNGLVHFEVRQGFDSVDPADYL